MLPTLDRDTRLCMSLSARPSNFGTRFHNFLFRAYGLNYVYLAFAITDIVGAVAGIRALGVRGSAISMPFKEKVLELVDELSPAVAAIGAANTLVADAGHIVAHNTDHGAVVDLLAAAALPATTRVILLGSGGMAKAVAAALADTGLRNVTVVSRNAATGAALAAAHGWDHRTGVGDLRADLLINTTPIGMAGGPEADDLAFAPAAVAAATLVFDVVALPVETPLIRLARSLDKPVITGAEVIRLQAIEQFRLYTGIRPDDERVAQADALARA